MGRYNGPLHEMTQTTTTEYWNDSCNTDELTEAMKSGAVGATSNPTIVLTVLKQQMDLWKGRIDELIRSNPSADETKIAWLIAEAITLKAAKLLQPEFEKSGGRRGRIAIQTNPIYFRNQAKIVEQGLHFHALAPNLTIKLPATAAGIEAAEELTYNGVSVTSTVSFTVPQVIAAADAVERGLRRRETKGKSVEGISANCVVMVGRLDDWLKVVAARDDITVDPECLEWAGVAVMKRCYEIFSERGYRSRLMAAAYRNHLHWSQFIGGDVIVTIPFRWAQRFNGSDITVSNQISKAVDPKIIRSLETHFADFKRAYEPDGMVPDEFASFGSSARTLRTFVQSYADLLAMIREFMVPNPDL